jgi:hypothetical protein
MSDPSEAVLREAENYLRSFTMSDLIYRDSVTIGGSLDGDEYVCVATWGAADELGKNDVPEEWPIRVRVHDADDNEAGAYLSLVEADELCRAIRAAMRRARRYPQPDGGADDAG